MQLEGMFDVPVTRLSETAFDVDLPIEGRDWHVGLIVGPSGSGKTTIARDFFPNETAWTPVWPEGRSIVEAFPDSMSMNDVVGLLSSVGFSSPPAWLRPHAALSNGEQFRANVALALARDERLTVIDEFTSVVDRTVAKVASHATAKAVRARGRQLIAVSCHYDILDWLQPDWMLDTVDMRFQWRELQQRPRVTLRVIRVGKDAWRAFRHHHYLSASLNPSARCFMGLVEGRPATFTAVLPFPHPRRPAYREHRTVCLPDFQGVGLGNAMSELIASIFRATGKPYFSTTSHPAMVRHRARSPLWVMTSPMGYNSPVGRSSTLQKGVRGLGTAQVAPGYRTRATASFEYVGDVRRDDARAFGIV